MVKSIEEVGKNLDLGGRMDEKIRGLRQFIGETDEKLDDLEAEAADLRADKRRAEDVLVVLEELRGDDGDGDPGGISSPSLPVVGGKDDGEDGAKEEEPAPETKTSDVDDPPKKRSKRVEKKSPKKKKPGPKPKKVRTPKKTDTKPPVPVPVPVPVPRPKAPRETDQGTQQTIREQTLDVLKSRPGHFMTLGGISMALCGDSENKGLRDHLSGLLKGLDERKEVNGLERQKDGRRVLYRIIEG